MKENKKMSDYSHDEFVSKISKMTEEEQIEFSKDNGGYPIFFRMALDERVRHIPFIQTGSAIIIRNEDKQILLQERTDRALWGLPGGCQEIGENLKDTIIREAYEETNIKFNYEDLILIDTLGGKERRNTYSSGDIVYNNTTLYLANVKNDIVKDLKGDSETKSLKFFDIDDMPKNLMDKDLIEAYKKYLETKKNNRLKIKSIKFIKKEDFEKLKLKKLNMKIKNSNEK